MKTIVALVLLTPAFAGCSDIFPSDDEEATGESYAELGFTGSDTTGRDLDAWPDLDGTLRILDHGAFPGFEAAAEQFENLTGVRVIHDDFGDTGSSLNVAVREAGDPSFDVFYGIDNLLLYAAVKDDVLTPYRPILADRIDPELVFFDADGPWYATPVDHGYIAVNWDRQSSSVSAPPVDNLFDVRGNAGEFVTQDPRTSTPGLGFLLATIATMGEGDSYDWQDYWTDLFEGGVLVTADWTTAYEQHFSGGYGPDYGGLGDRALVTSYTESPAFEHFYGRPEEQIAGVVLAPKSTFHQIQTMGILAGTGKPAAAQAWIEFTLTDFFQELAAPSNAVYPVVPSVNVTDTYGGLDPQPGSFTPAQFDYETIGENLDRWLDEWTELCEDHACA